MCPTAKSAGSIRRNGIVWINVGRADGLQPLMTFSVYPDDISDLSKGAVKGSVEVTKILGDHMAEARITDDTITDPFMPGDKIDTSLWSPGEQSALRAGRPDGRQRRRPQRPGTGEESDRR